MFRATVGVPPPPPLFRCKLPFSCLFGQRNLLPPPAQLHPSATQKRSLNPQSHAHQTVSPDTPRFAPCSFLDAQVIRCLSDPDLPVRVDAVAAIRQFVEEVEDVEMIKPILPGLLDSVFRLMGEVGGACGVAGGGDTRALAGRAQCAPTSTLTAQPLSARTVPHAVHPCTVHAMRVCIPMDEVGGWALTGPCISRCTRTYPLTCSMPST